jgi:hypothetical protein
MADELGIVMTGEQLVYKAGMGLEEIVAPPLFSGNMRIELRTEAFVLRPQYSKTASLDTFASISGRSLAGYRLTFDIPHQRFTLSDLSNPWTSGEMLLSPIHPETCFARVEVEIDETDYGMLLDTGVGCTTVSPGIFERWSQEHPDWPWIEGAFGTANQGQRIQDEGARMMRIPLFGLGSSQLPGICVVTRPVGEQYEQFSKQMLTGPAIGALGGNVLKHFCYEINYVTGVSHLRQQSQSEPYDLDMVGLSLYPAGAGRWGVLAVADQSDAGVRTMVQPGDMLLEVDRRPITGQPLQRAIDALRGWPGDMRILLLERGETSPRAGARYLVEASVVRLL